MSERCRNDRILKPRIKKNLSEANEEAKVSDDQNVKLRGRKSSRCFAPGCPNRGDKGFFRFPNEEGQKLQWLKFFDIAPKNWVPKMRICEAHFKESDYTHEK